MCVCVRAHVLFVCFSLARQRGELAGLARLQRGAQALSDCNPQLFAGKTADAKRWRQELQMGLPDVDEWLTLWSKRDFKAWSLRDCTEISQPVAW